MKFSPSLAWRSFTSRIHPPLPLTLKQSQELLARLNLSFRKELDRKHPLAYKDYAACKQGLETLAIPAPGCAVKASFVSADEHISSILLHPLFALNPDRIPSLKPNETVSQSRKIWSDPVAYFEREVAVGRATLDTVKYCLTVQRNVLANATDKSVDEAILQCDAAEKIARFLCTSGISLEGALDDLGFIKLVTPFLVAERHHHIVWNWMDILKSRIEKEPNTESADPRHHPVLRTPAFLLLSWVKAIYKNHQKADKAIPAFIHAVRIFSQPGASGRQVCWKTGGWLTTALTKNSSLRPIISGSDYDDLVSTTSSWARDAEFQRCQLLLYHPLSPDATPALSYLHNFAWHHWSLKSTWKRRQIIWLSLECARVLLERENMRDAVWVMSFVQKNFGAELFPQAEDDVSGTSQKDSTPSDEEKSLKLLAALETV